MYENIRITYAGFAGGNFPCGALYGTLYGTLWYTVYPILSAVGTKVLTGVYPQFGVKYCFLIST